MTTDEKILYLTGAVDL